MPYWRMFAHIVWATKNRVAMIGEIEDEIVRASLSTTFTELGVIPHVVGTMPDHVHVVVSVPPKVAVADLVRRMKGASAHAINADRRRPAEPKFAWQDEYGVLSFGEKALPDVVRYVQNQPEIHARRAIWPGMERISDDQESDHGRRGGGHDREPASPGDESPG